MSDQPDRVQERPASSVKLEPQSLSNQVFDMQQSESQRAAKLNGASYSIQGAGKPEVPCRPSSLPEAKVEGAYIAIYACSNGSTSATTLEAGYRDNSNNSIRVSQTESEKRDGEFIEKTKTNSVRARTGGGN